MEGNNLELISKQYQELASKLDRVVIDLGCGKKKFPNSIGIDSEFSVDAEVRFDLNKGLPFIEKDSVDLIYTRHFLEHLLELQNLMLHCFRILKGSGTFKIIVPHFSNPYYYSDLTHVNMFGLYSFDYFTPLELQKLKRKVPNFYSRSTPFMVRERKLVFKSSFKFINLIDKHIITKVVNSTSYFQEFYEAYLSKIYSVYEVHYTLSPLKGQKWE